MRGVPLRMELGPKDVAKGSVVLRPGEIAPVRKGSRLLPQEGIAAAVSQGAGRDSDRAI